MECWNNGIMGLGLRLVEFTLRPVSLWAGSGLGEDTAILGKWSAEGGTNIKLRRINFKKTYQKNDGATCRVVAEGEA